MGLLCKTAGITQTQSFPNTGWHQKLLVGVLKHVFLGPWSFQRGVSRMKSEHVHSSKFQAALQPRPPLETAAQTMALYIPLLLNRGYSWHVWTDIPRGTTGSACHSGFILDLLNEPQLHALHQ